MERRNLRQTYNNEERLSAVEATTAHLDQRFNKMEAAIDKGFAEINSRLTETEERNRPHVLAWAGWAAVLLMVASLFINAIKEDVDLLRADVRHIQSNRVSFADPVQDQAIITNRNTFNASDAEIRQDIHRNYNEYVESKKEIIYRIQRLEEGVWTKDGS